MWNFFSVLVVEQLKKTSLRSEDRISKLESRLQSTGNNVAAQAGPAAAAANNNKSDDDDGVDLFGSDSEGEDEAAAKIREQRLAEYAAKKSKSKLTAMVRYMVGVLKINSKLFSVTQSQCLSQNQMLFWM